MRATNYPDFGRLYPDRSLEEELVLMQKLFFLALHDVIFFGTWDQAESERLGNAYWGEDAIPCLLCNHTFYYASADAENFEESDIDIIIDLYKRFAYAGVTAWIAAKRGIEPLSELNNDAYKLAVEYLKADGTI
jgi:hypothetical protein